MGKTINNPTITVAGKTLALKDGLTLALGAAVILACDLPGGKLQAGANVGDGRGLQGIGYDDKPPEYAVAWTVGGKVGNSGTIVLEHRDGGGQVDKVTANFTIAAPAAEVPTPTPTVPALGKWTRFGACFWFDNGPALVKAGRQIGVTHCGCKGCPVLSGGYTIVIGQLYADPVCHPITGPWHSTTYDFSLLTWIDLPADTDDAFATAISLLVEAINTTRFGDPYYAPLRISDADVNGGWKPRPVGFGAATWTFTWAACYLNGEQVDGIFPSGAMDNTATPRTYEFAPGHAPWEIDPIDGLGDTAVDHGDYPLFEDLHDFDKIGFASHDNCHDGSGPGSGSGSGTGGSGPPPGTGTGGTSTGVPTGPPPGSGTGGTSTGDPTNPTGPPPGSGTGGTGGRGSGTGPCLPCAGYKILENADAMIVLSLTDSDTGTSYDRTFHLTLVGITTVSGQQIAYYRLGSSGFDAYFNCVTNEWVFAPGTLTTPDGLNYIYNLVVTGSGDSISGSVTLNHEPAENVNGSTAQVSGTIYVTVGNTCEYGP